VTPDIAEAWLSKNKNNRKISRYTVDTLARAMENDNWEFNGEAIQFDDSGNLINGQHRLTACVQSGCNFETLVVYGVSFKAVTTIDTGRPRRATDVLTMNGLVNSAKLASAARLLLMIKNGVITEPLKFTHREILEAAKARPQLQYSVSKTMGVVGLSPTLAAFIHYAGGHVVGLNEVADSFIDVFKTGSPSYPGCPAHALRERLIRSGDTRNSVKRKDMLKISFHAWNLFAQGKPVENLRTPNEAVIDGLDIKKL